MRVRKYDIENATVDGSAAAGGFDRTKINIPVKKSILAVGVLLFVFAAIVALYLSYQTIFLIYTIYIIYMLITYVVLWVDGKYARKPPHPHLDRWPDVSIVIPSYNAGHTIFGCIESCKKMEYPGKVEIIVVDDGSKDGSDKKLEKLEGIRFIRKEKNEGKAAALNTALEAAKGEFVACVDSDTYPKSDVLRKIIPYFNHGEKVGAVTLFVNAPPPTNLLQAMQEIEYWISFGFYFKTVEVIDGLYVTPGPMSVYRKKVFEELGGYDEKNIGEDMEIALRLQRHGWKIRLCSDAIAYTEVPLTLGTLYKQRLRWVRGAIMNVLKYVDMFFNPKYGYFGLFILPMVIFNGLFAALFTFWTLAMMGKSLLNWLLPWASNFYAVAPVAIRMPVADVYLLDSTFLFGLVSFMLFGYFVYTGFKLSGEKPSVKHIVPLIGLILVFPFFLGVVFLSGYAHEFSARKYKW